MELLLQTREILDFGRGQQALHIICRGGRCWLTQAGDARDYILNPGDCFTVRTKGQLVVTATQPCRLAVIPAGNNRLPKPSLRPLLGRKRRRP